MSFKQKDLDSVLLSFTKKQKKKQKMDERFSNYFYNGQFSGNIMVVRRTGCGKTTFIQNLGRNKMFGRDIHTVF